MNPSLQQLLAAVQADSTALLTANANLATAQANYGAALSAFATAEISGNQATIQTAATTLLTANANLTASQATYRAAVATLEADRSALEAVIVAALPPVITPP